MEQGQLSFSATLGNYHTCILCFFPTEDRFGAVKRAGGHTASGTEADDTGDELLESAFRSAATAGPRQRGERKRSQYRHRKSCKSDHESSFF